MRVYNIKHWHSYSQRSHNNIRFPVYSWSDTNSSCLGYMHIKVIVNRKNRAKIMTVFNRHTRGDAKVMSAFGEQSWDNKSW